MTSRRLPLLLAPVLAAAVALGVPHVGHAAPSVNSITIGYGTTDPANVAFSGGPITGGSDGAGNAPPPVVCQAPACESIPVTLKAPASDAGKLILTLTVTFDTTPVPNPAGVSGLDAYLLDSNGNELGGDTLGSSPSVATATKLSPGAYTIEISGEAATNQTYTGTLAASVGAASAPVVTSLGFSPATVVSPTLLGAEPQISFEHPSAAAKSGAGLDGSRGFVDWPISSRTQIGSLWRTTDGGDTYRQLVDLSCAERQVPNCDTGGGGDTVNRVNNYDGTLLFGDQESLAQEAFASSTDHGDSFPATRQFAASSAATSVDRQWISAVEAPGVMAGPVTSFELEALFSYHIPAAGEYVAGIGTDGILRPAATPVIASVSQSGPSRVDSKRQWFYQGYRDGNGFEVATAPLSQYQSPTAYVVHNVTTDTAQVFPWINLDSAGNLYAVWVAGDGNLYLSYSLIGDAANDPAHGGVPATKWSPKLKINPPSLTSTIFPAIVAGDPGRIAIVFDGTGDASGVSDNVGTAARWSTYVLESTNALSASPTFQLGDVSHRVVHVGTICTAGTTCPTVQGDRSLLDMIDITTDSAGRPSVVFTDNNNQYARDEFGLTGLFSQGTPYVKVAKLASGPSLFASHADIAATYPTQYRSTPAGNATWPNTAAGQNLPALDITGNAAYVDAANSNLVVRIDLADASAAGVTRDLAAYNASRGTDAAASRLQYVARWDSPGGSNGQGDAYYLAAELGGAQPAFYGGKLDSTDAFNNGTSAVGVAYRGQSSFTVTGKISGNSLYLQVPLAQIGAASGGQLLSFASYSLAGPADTAIQGQNDTSQVILAMRTIDSAAPMDVVLAQPGPGANVPEAPWLPLMVAAGVAAVAVRQRRRFRR